MNYKNGKIYALRTHQSNEIYIGSTCSPLYKRLYQHKTNYNNWLNGKMHYITSYEILKYDDVYIDLIEEYPCENKLQLRKKEGEYQREMDCINKNIAGRTNKEYNDDNKDKILEYHKQYYEDNKEKIKEQSKQYRENNKEKIKEQQKEYYEDNKQKILERQNQYNNNNKDKIKQRKMKKITCECGVEVTRNNMSRHKKSDKHDKLIEDYIRLRRLLSHGV